MRKVYGIWYSSCNNYMMGDKSKFIESEKTEQSYLRIGDSKQVQVFEKEKVIVKIKEENAT